MIGATVIAFIELINDKIKAINEQIRIYGGNKYHGYYQSSITSNPSGILVVATIKITEKNLKVIIMMKDKKENHV